MKKIILILSMIATGAFAVTGNMVWRIPSAGSLGAWGPVNLSDGTNAVTGTLGLTHGGTGLSSAPTFFLFSANTLGWGGANDFPGVVSAAPSTNGLMIVRAGGTTNSSTISGGEGYTYNSSSSGVQNLNVTIPFQDQPICVCSATSVAAVCTASYSGGIIGIETFTSSTGSVVSAAYNVICIGQRNSSH